MAAVTRFNSETKDAVDSASSIPTELINALARGRPKQGATEEVSDLRSSNLLAGDLQSRSPIRRPILRRRTDDSNLLSADLSGAAPEARERAVVCFGSVRRGCGLSPLQAMSPAHLTRYAGMAGHFVGSIPRAEANLQWRPRRRRCRGTRRTCGSRCAPPAPTVPPTSGSVTRADCTNPARPLRPEPDRRDRSCDHQDCFLLRL